MQSRLTKCLGGGLTLWHHYMLVDCKGEHVCMSGTAGVHLRAKVYLFFILFMCSLYKFISGCISILWASWVPSVNHIFFCNWFSRMRSCSYGEEDITFATVYPASGRMGVQTEKNNVTFWKYNKTQFLTLSYFSRMWKSILHEWDFLQLKACVVYLECMFNLYIVHHLNLMDWVASSCFCF